MKIQCDVCNKDEASVFCVADEAALCDGCDHRVHHANKLSRKHHRFSLLKPSINQFPICDICQEKKAFLFCQEDRAILCKDCDIPIHKANEHTKNHNRFLLTGIKLSATSAMYSPTHDQEEDDVVPDHFNKTVLIDKPVSVAPKITNSNGKKSSNPQVVVSGCHGSTSSISEYLMENIPGWHVEDFLDFSNSTPPINNGFFKNEVLPFWDGDLEGNLNSFSQENMGFWVPQAPVHEMQYSSELCPTSKMGFGGQIWFQEPNKSATITNIKSSRKWRDIDGGFTVPEITPPPPPPYMVAKKSRNLFL